MVTLPYDNTDIIVPPQRKPVGQPSVLLPNADLMYIAPLLVILHSIPLARKAFLDASNKHVSDYIYARNWWNDVVITHPSLPRSHLERLVMELQRLMVFLDQSQRPFCSLNTIAKQAIYPPSAQALRGDSSSDNPVGRFLQDICTYWTSSGHANNTSREYARIFESSALTADEPPRRFSNLIADVTVSLNEKLYDLIDDLVWPSNPMDTFLEDIAEVITITLKRDDGISGAGIDVPVTWYPDRYSREMLPLIRHIKDRKKEAQKEIARMSKEKFSLSSTMGKDASKLFTISLEYLANVHDSSDDISEAIEDIKRSQDAFESKKSDLVKNIAKLQQQVETESQFFKGPLNSDIQQLFPDTEIPTLRPYHLCGAIISQDEFFFQTGNNHQDLINLDDVVTWYKFELSYDLPSISKTSLDEVLESVKRGSSKYEWQEATLIYASDYSLDSLKHQATPTLALQQFIDRDNAALDEELDINISDSDHSAISENSTASASASESESASVQAMDFDHVEDYDGVVTEELKVDEF